VGVYYSAAIGWGLRIDPSSLLNSPDNLVFDEWAFEHGLPEDMLFTEGGDLMSGTDEAVLVHPRDAATTVMDTGGRYSDVFGVREVREFYTPKAADRLALVEWASNMDCHLISAGSSSQAWAN